MSCSWPKDPEDTFEQARHKGLRVGVVSTPQDRASIDREKAMLVAFAKANTMQLTFVEDSETRLIELLKQYELAIVCGGFTKNTLWKEEAGLTRPYDKEHVLLIPKGENKLAVALEAFMQKHTAQ